jgi:predicted CopG family antitoxin
MSPVIRVTSEVYSRLEKLAVGFDSPANVIEKLLNSYDDKNGNVKKTKSTSSKARLFTNKEIQQKISNVAKHFSAQELDDLCNDSSKKIFDISFPLLVKISNRENGKNKKDAVKSEDGVNRWTWKYQIEKGNFIYAICTQWYPKNDTLVKDWLEIHDRELTANKTNKLGHFKAWFGLCHYAALHSTQIKPRFKMPVIGDVKSPRRETMRKIVSTLASALFLFPITVLAWDGYDYESGDYVEFEEGNLVREGEEVEYYDYDSGEYRYGDVESVESSGSGAEVEVYDYESGEYRTFEMD